MTQTPEQEERSLRILKSVVIGMGILLVVGTIALFVAIIVKSSSNDKPVNKKISSTKVQPIQECKKNTNIDLPIIGNVISAQNDNGIVTIATSKQVVVYDLCSNEVMVKFNSLGQ